MSSESWYISHLTDTPSGMRTSGSGCGKGRTPHRPCRKPSRVDPSTAAKAVCSFLLRPSCYKNPDPHRDEEATRKLTSMLHVVIDAVVVSSSWQCQGLSKV